jgi:CelD/BcsL family acetyltransferase involved in cellulose biosynthesis
MAIEIREIDSLDYFGSAEGDWRRLLRKSGEDDVFLTPEWHQAWWETMGEGREPLFLEASSGGEVVGIAPLMISTRGRVKRWRKLEFAATGPSDRLGILANNGDQAVHLAFWDFILKRGAWDVLELRDMNQDGPTELASRKAFANGERNGEVCPFLPLKGDYARYLAGLAKPIRHNIFRYSRRLEQLGAEFRVATTTSDTKHALLDLVRINSERWKDTGTGAFFDPGMHRFLEKVIDRFSGKDTVVFHGIWIKELPIAVVMGFFYRNRHLYYIPGFNPQYSEYSPGSVIHAKIIEDCFARGLTEVDFLRGGESHKYRFNAQERRNVHVRAFGKGFVRRVEGLAREGDLT